MSLYDYVKAGELRKTDPPFAALIMAAMYKADTNNFVKLGRAFPKIASELQQRYDQPGGTLKGEALPGHSLLEG